MNRRTITGLGAAAAAFALVLTGCSRGPSSDAPAPSAGEHTGTDEHAQINPLDPATLGPADTAIAAMQTILGWQPAVDGSKTPALIRARPYLGGQLLAATETNTDVKVKYNAQWYAWVESKDVLAATCKVPDDAVPSPPAMTTQVVDLVCRQQVLHTSGLQTPLPDERYRTTVTHTDQGWRLTDYRIVSG